MTDTSMTDIAKNTRMIRWERDDTGIVTLTMDDPNNPVNTMNDLFIDSLDEAVTRLENERDQIAGVILASAKSSWFAGGNLDELITASPETAAEETARVNRMKRQFRRLETLGRPVVAAINGTALGGGYEVALGCHHRIATDNPRTRIGLPEITLGMFPGAGGATRTVRMLGIEKALTQVLLPGTRFRVRDARAIGLIDDIVPDDSTPENAALLAVARAWIEANPDATQPWDRAGFRIPGGEPSTAWMSPASLGSLPAYPARLRAQLKGAPYPAPRALLASVIEGAQVHIDMALEIETRYFVSVIDSQVASNMIGAFFADMREVTSGASRPADIPKRTVSKLGVIGAGMMGSAIAYTAARAGVDVVLIDTDPSAGKRAFEYACGRESASILRRMPDASEHVIDAVVSPILSRLRFSTQMAELAEVELVIEAAFEDLGVKRELFDRAETMTPPGTVLASNTSTLPISDIADAAARDEFVVGMHFFSPVDKMALVELVRSPTTSDETLALAFDFARQIGKTPIIVNDSRGFFTSRVIFRYIEEALSALDEGVSPVSLERAAERAGYAVSPLKLIDELSLTLVDRIWRENAEALGSRGDLANVWSPTAGAARSLERMLVVGRPGRAAGAGFYAYADGKRGLLWDGLSAGLPPHPTSLEDAREHPSESIVRDLGERMLFSEALEAVRCFDEGVMVSLADANIGSLLGIGFPSWTGGAMRYIEQYEGGVAGFVARAEQLSDLYGIRFVPPASLIECAAREASLAEIYSGVAV